MNAIRKRIRLQEILWLALFGTVWGLNEFLAGGAFYKAHPESGSVWLIALGVAVLALARGVVDRTGSSVVLALIAAFYKSVNTQPFVCHILGIAMLGLTFEAAYGFLLRKDRTNRIRQGMLGPCSVYLSNLVFAFLLAVILRESYWVAEGYAKVYHYISITGTTAATISVFIVPLCLSAGAGLSTWASRFPAWTVSASAAATCAIWIIGSF